jgi:hypothetical protein
MELLARTTDRLISRYRYGLWAYWFINAALVVAEVHWHLLYHLTVWDFSTLAALVDQIHRSGVGAGLPVR